MADEIRITSSFDATPIVEGIQKAADAVQEAGSEITSSFGEIASAVVPSEAAIQAAGQSVSKFLTQIGAISAESETAAPALATVANAATQTATAIAGFDAASSGVTALLTQLTGLAEEEQGAAEGASSLGIALSSAGAGANSLLNALGQTSESLESTVTLAAEVDDEISATSLGFNSAAEAAQAYASGIAAAGEASSVLLAQLGAVGEEAQLAFQGFEEAQLVTPAVSLLGEAILELQLQEQSVVDLQSALSESLDAIGQSAAQSAEQLSLFSEASTAVAEAASNASVQIVEASQAIADSNGQLQFLTNALDAATGQYQLFEQVTFDTAASQAELQTQVQANVVVINNLTSILSQLGTITGSVAGALQFLSSTTAILNSTSEEFTNAVVTVNGALEKYNLQLIGTVGSLKLAQAAEEGATGATRVFDEAVTSATGRVTGLSGALGYLSGRTVAYELGVGQLGFALGILGRTLAPLNQLLLAAFPIVAPLLLADVVSSLADKFEHLDDSIRKATTEFADLAISTEVASEQLALQNLKLEDQINKFEGRPTQNRLAEAAMEARIEVDKLSKSMGDAIEKELELLEKSNVTLLDFALTGKAPTSIIGDLGSSYKELEGNLAEYSLAVREQRLANDNLVQDASDTNKKLKAAADERVANARTAVQKEAQGRLQDVESGKAADLARVKQGDARAFAPNTVAEVNAAYADQEIRLSSILETTRAQADEEKNLSQNIKEKTSVAQAANAEEARTRKKVETEPDIRAEEEQARLLSTVHAREAEETYKTTQENIKLQVEQATAGGDLRLKAELDTDDKLLAARKQLTTELLAAEKERYDGERKGLEDQKALVASTEVGPKRVADIKSLNAQLDRLEEQHVANNETITIQGENEITRITADEIKQRAELLNKANSEIVRNAKESIRARVEDAKLNQADEAASIKASADEQLRAVDSAERLKVASIKRAHDERIAIFTDEQSKLQDQLSLQKSTILGSQQDVLEAQQSIVSNLLNNLPAGSAQIARLTDLYHQLGEAIRLTDSAQDDLNNPQVLAAQQQFISALQKSLPEGSPALQQLRQLYDQLAESIKKAGAAQDQLNSKFDKAKGAAEQKYLDDLTKSYEHMFGQITDRAGEAFAEMVQRGATFREAMTQQILALESDAIRSIFHHLTVFLASKAAEVTAAHSSETAKTASTAAGTTTRTGIESVHTAKVIALDISKVTSHVASEVKKTAITIAEESKRIIIATVNFIKHLVFRTQDVTQTTVTESQKTASAIASNAAILASDTTTNSALLANNIATSVGSIAAEKAATASRIASEVAKAGAGGVASMAAAPFPIDLGAPAFGAAMAALAGSYGAIAALATGGPVVGPGSGTSDSIPAMLSHGEYVLQATAVNRIGVPFLEAVNKGTPIPGFASGGLVGSSSGGATATPVGANSSVVGNQGGFDPNVAKLAAAANGNRIRVEIAHIDVKLGVGNFLTGGLGSLFGGLGHILGLSEGGKVSGAGSTISDSIPTMLSSGEYVVNAGAVSQLGTGFLDAVNGHSLEFKGSTINNAVGISAARTLPSAVKIGSGSSSSTKSQKTIHVQPEINYYQHGSEPDMSQLHETIVSAVNTAIRRGQIKGFD